LLELVCHNKVSIHKPERTVISPDGEQQVTQVEELHLNSNKPNYQLSNLHTEVAITTEKSFALVSDLEANLTVNNIQTHVVVTLVAP